MLGEGPFCVRMCVCVQPLNLPPYARLFLYIKRYLSLLPSPAPNPLAPFQTHNRSRCTVVAFLPSVLPRSKRKDMQLSNEFLFWERERENVFVQQCVLHCFSSFCFVFTNITNRLCKTWLIPNGSFPRGESFASKGGGSIKSTWTVLNVHPGRSCWIAQMLTLPEKNLVEGWLVEYDRVAILVLKTRLGYGEILFSSRICWSVFIPSRKWKRRRKLCVPPSGEKVRWAGLWIDFFSTVTHFVRQSLAVDKHTQKKVHWDTAGCWVQCTSIAYGAQLAGNPSPSFLLASATKKKGGRSQKKGICLYPKCWPKNIK